jgi:hypothetical protein
MARQGSSRGPVGDPAFRRDDSAQLTHEPIREDERGRAARPSARRRPALYVWLGVVAVFTGLGLLVGATAGWVYVIPFVVLGALVAVFFASMKADAGDTVPDLDFPERSGEAGEADAPHADVRRGTARR